MATTPKKHETAKPAKPVVKMVRVRALERGYDNVAVREPGDEFEMPEGASGPWFEPVEAAE